MAMANNFTLHMPPFDPDTDIGASVAPRWKLWVCDFNTFLIANDITAAKRKRAMLLFLAGPRVRDIFRQLPDTGSDADFDTALAKLNEYFEPQTNRVYEVYKFRQAKQEPNENIDTFHTRLRGLGETCDFHDLDFEIMLQIVLHGTSSRLRKLALRDNQMTLKNLLLLGRQEEMSTFQAAAIAGKETEDISYFQKKPNPTQRSGSRDSQGKTCRNCGGVWPHRHSDCPAKGKPCRNCKKLNHFAKVCRSKVIRSQTAPQSAAVRPVSTAENVDSDSDFDYCYTVETKGYTSKPHMDISVNGQMINFLIDTGSSINVISNRIYMQKLTSVVLQKTNIKAMPFNSKTPVHLKGKFLATLETKRKINVATIYVTADDGGCLLSSKTAQELGLVSLNLNTIQVSTMQNSQLPDLDHVPDLKAKEIIRQHQTVFHGIGKLKDKQITLSIDKEVKPVAQQTRRIPFHVRAKVELELQKLEKQDIIEKVPDTEHTDWVSPIVVVPKKDGRIRMCVDMRAANTAIKRIRHPIPTVKDISMELNGAKFFSKLDMSQAYHQLELSPESRGVTTFTTHAGLYRYKRLNYGTNSAAEIFQHTLTEVLKGIKGVKNMADDIIIFAATRDEHHRALKACLQRLQEHDLKLNITKCEFLKKNLEFFGFVFSEKGTQPDPNKIAAFVNSAQPQTASEVRNLLGMANYSAQFIKDFATITEPLRKLTCKDTPFQWTDEHQAAYEKLKTALTNSPVMSYFDITKETQILVDASPVGLSAILAQRNPKTNKSQIVAYASRALTDTESRYSQTEKEALAIVWGIEHFHIYVYGAPFILYTDHKPLELIYGNKISKPPARIERWMLRLQQYAFTVVYKAGADNPADYLSRHPVKIESKEQSNIAEEYVNFLANSAVPASLTIDEIKNATKEDRTLRALNAALKTGFWNVDRLKPYKQIKDEITFDHVNHVFLRGTRLILPDSLQDQVIKLAHQGHQGLSKTTALIREHVWFPHLDKKVKSEIEGCLACQSLAQPNPPEPLLSPPMSSNPWEHVKVDFCGPFPSGHHILVVIDCYSRFPEIEVLKSTSAVKVIPKLDTIFARHGVPVKLTSDNGSPFQGDEFKRYMQQLGIEHHHSTPLWPQGNSEVEAFNKPLSKAIKAAHVENRPWQQELSKFLLNYRSTPHSTTNIPPSQLLYNRQMRGILPTLPSKCKVVNRHQEAKENQELRKEKERVYANQRRGAKESLIKVGDRVLIKQKKRNKLSTNFNTTPYIITSARGTRLTAEYNGHKITRNASFFKKFNGHIADDDSNFDDQTIEHGNHKDNEGTPEKQLPRRSTRNRYQTERYGEPIDSNLIT